MTYNEAWRDGDIVRWRYTDKRLKELSHGNNGGTTYWCCSQIAVFRNGRFADTFWSGDNKTFLPQDIGETIEVTHLANFDELRSGKKWEEDYYDPKDIVDLSHPNNSGQFYIRLSAKRSLEKMREVLTQRIDHSKWALKSAQQDIVLYTKKLDELTEDTKDSTYI